MYTLERPDPEPVSPDVAGLDAFTICGRPEVPRDLMDPDGILVKTG